MNISTTRACLLFICGLNLSIALCAQELNIDFPALSPVSTLKQRIGLTDVEIVYSRPSARGRTMLGGVTPYGEVWRTGANTATTIQFSTAVKLNGADVPAGTYGLYTIPSDTEWTVIIYTDTIEWGAYKYDQKKDLIRFKATPSKLAERVETFTILFSDLHDESATLNLIWEKTRVPVTLEVDIVKKLVSQIEAAMAEPGKKSVTLYAKSATFYLEHNQDLAKALRWIEAARVEAPLGVNLAYLKAKILAKMGDKAGAIAAANEGIEVAIKGGGRAKDEYTRLNQALIDSLH